MLDNEQNDIQEPIEDLFEIEDIFIEEPKKPVFSYILVGFLVPLIGFIMFFIYKRDKPEEADAFLDGAIIGVFSFIIIFLLIVGYLNHI